MPNLESIKEFVKGSQIKGVGDDSDYGYYQFVYDLTEICGDLVEEKGSLKGDCLFGDVPEVDLEAVILRKLVKCIQRDS